MSCCIDKPVSKLCPTVINTTMRELVISYVEITSHERTSQKIREEAERALYGNRTCSLENMKTTCFASELCSISNGNKNFPRKMTFQNESTLTLIAHTTGGTAMCGDSKRFVGCICVGPFSLYPSRWFPDYLKPTSDTHVIFNLCVSSDFQGGGVGRQLINAVRQRMSCPLYLFVLRGTKNTPLANITDIMKSREERLLKTYTRMRMKLVAKMDECVLFQVQ